MAASLGEILKPISEKSNSSAQPPVRAESAPESAVDVPTPGEEASPENEGVTTEAAPPAAQTEAEQKPQPNKPWVDAALKDERRKRQDLERKLAELEGQVKVYSQTVQPAPAAPQPSPEDQFYKDPVGFIRQQAAADRLRMSEDLMRDAHADYDDVVSHFLEAARAAPHLAAGLHTSANPAKYAYQTGKAYMQAREYGSVDEMRSKIRDELKTEIREELRREAAESAASAVQPSLANARGSGPSTKPQWRGPTPLKQIFGR